MTVAERVRPLTMARFLGARPVVFTLAFLSFACLLGHFYGLWTMRFFGCWVMPPAAALLGGMAYRHRERAPGLDNPATWIGAGIPLPQEIGRAGRSSRQRLNV